MILLQIFICSDSNFSNVGFIALLHIDKKSKLWNIKTQAHFHKKLLTKKIQASGDRTFSLA